MTNEARLPPAKEQLLLAAERLFASKGLGAVSVREITIAAGQKNHSALSYHFGTLDAVLEAILDYRMTPLNRRREEMLQQVKDEHQQSELRSLVEVMVLPFADELLRPPEESCYLRLLSQLMSQGEWQSVFTAHPHRASAVIEAGQLMFALLAKDLGDEIAGERLRLFGLHLINAVTEWDAMGRRGELQLTQENLSWRIDNLVDYLGDALSANHTNP